MGNSSRLSVTLERLLSDRANGGSGHKAAGRLAKNLMFQVRP